MERSQQLVKCLQVLLPQTQSGSFPYMRCPGGAQASSAAGILPWGGPVNLSLMPSLPARTWSHDWEDQTYLWESLAPTQGSAHHNLLCSGFVEASPPSECGAKVFRGSKWVHREKLPSAICPATGNRLREPARGRTQSHAREEMLPTLPHCPALPITGQQTLP